MRTALNIQKEFSSLDPALIETGTQYDLIWNLYGRLIRYDSDGQLVSDVPTSFTWSKDEVFFNFGDRVKTLGGHLLGASDAEDSLKRLVLKGRSGHGDIRRFLCPGHQLKSLNDTCPGIRVEGNTLVLKVSQEEHLPLLIATLESADYSIIPKDNIDPKSGDLIRLDHKETSGPYYLAGTDAHGTMTLKANPGHYLFHPEMPREVEVLRAAGGEAMAAFKRGELDLLPSDQYWGGPEAREILSDSRNEVFQTFPMRLLLVVFSPRALSEFSPEQRMFAGLKAGTAFRENFGQTGGQPTEQFFQLLSDGSLSEEQLTAVRALRAGKEKTPQFHRPMTLGGVPRHFDVMNAALAGTPEIAVIPTESHPLAMAPADRPDMYLITTDSAWTENLSLLGHNFEVGVFSMPSLDSKEWFQSYIQVQDKEERIQLLRKLHFDLLSNASMVPIEVAPYYWAAKPNWDLRQSKIKAGTELWTIRRK